jgi:flagellar basal body-associated protein FliL
MAEENEVQEAQVQSAKSGGGGGMLPALLVVILMPVISFAMFKFLFLPEIVKHAPVAGEVHHEEIDPHKIHVETGEKHLVSFGDLIVNINGTGGARFLRVAFSLESTNPEIEDEVEAHKAKMQDLATTVLRHLTMADLERPNITDTVRNQLIQGFDQVLQPPMIDEIYFTQFVIQ